MTEPRSITARVFAALALAVGVLAVVVVVSSVNGGDDHSASGTTQSAKAKQKKSSKATRNRQKTYEVKVGDTLTGISEKTGVPIEDIELLNPDLDPQALQAGQELKLR